MGSVLVTGATGQIGSELIQDLRSRDQTTTIIGTDIQTDPKLGEPYIQADVTSYQDLKEIFSQHNIDIVYHLAALLSAEGENSPSRTFDVNVGGLRNLISLGRDHNINKIIIPSSIAVYGPNAPECPGELTTLRPTTMYGITKAITEQLGRYYSQNTALDIRGVRLPGVISYKTKPSGGTTDYAVNAYFAAVEQGEYNFFVRPDTELPMIYILDAVKALTSLADADRSSLRFHCEYNVSGLTFSAKELTDCIRERLPSFQAQYEPDERQAIADSWPAALNDAAAGEDWGWEPQYDLERITDEMLRNLTGDSSQVALSE